MHNNNTAIADISLRSKSSLSRLYPWLVWTLSACFFFYKYLVQVSPSVMTSDLMHAFNVNATGLGNLSACYFYAYLLMQIPVGILLDKFSLRFLTSCAILVCAISTFVFSQSDSLVLACISRAFIGFGAAFAAVSSFKLATIWFPAHRFALVSGMCMTAAMLGAIGGQLPLSMLVSDHGWRTALKIVGAAGIVLSLLYFILIKDAARKKSNKVSQPISILSSLMMIIKSKQAWLLSLYSGLAFAPVSVFGGLWGVPFLEQAHQLTAAHAALAVSWIFVGFAIGAPISGWISDTIQRRKPVMFLGIFMAFLCLLAVLYLPISNMIAICVLLFLFGFGASGFFTSFAMIHDVFPIVLAATVLGFMNTFDSICEALFEPLVGVVLDLTWAGTIANGVHVYSLGAYKLALGLLPACMFIALLLLTLIKETYCNAKE